MNYNIVNVSCINRPVLNVACILFSLADMRTRIQSWFCFIISTRKQSTKVREGNAMASSAVVSLRHELLMQRSDK